jgi:hypothetical protein
MRSVTLIIAVTTLVGCSPTAPGPQLIVTLAGPTSVQGADTTIGGQDDYYCRYALAATAGPGSTGAAAAWSAGADTLYDQSTYFYYTVPSDTLGGYGDSLVTFANSGQLFHNQPTLAAGTTVTGDETVIFGSDEGPPPYLSSLVVYYYSTAPTHTRAATYELTCA